MTTPSKPSTPSKPKLNAVIVAGQRQQRQQRPPAVPRRPTDGPFVLPTDDLLHRLLTTERDPCRRACLESLHVFRTDHTLTTEEVFAAPPGTLILLHHSGVDTTTYLLRTQEGRLHWVLRGEYHHNVGRFTWQQRFSNDSHWYPLSTEVWQRTARAWVQQLHTAYGSALAAMRLQIPLGSVQVTVQAVPTRNVPGLPATVGAAWPGDVRWMSPTIRVVLTQAREGRWVWLQDDTTRPAGERLAYRYEEGLPRTPRAPVPIPTEGFLRVNRRWFTAGDSLYGDNINGLNSRYWYTTLPTLPTHEGPLSAWAGIPLAMNEVQVGTTRWQLLLPSGEWVFRHTPEHAWVRATTVNAFVPPNLDDYLGREYAV
jgi:hypothetical protein